MGELQGRKIGGEYRALVLCLRQIWTPHSVPQFLRTGRLCLIVWTICTIRAFAFEYGKHPRSMVKYHTFVFIIYSFFPFQNISPSLSLKRGRTNSEDSMKKRLKISWQMRVYLVHSLHYIARIEEGEDYFEDSVKKPLKLSCHMGFWGVNCPLHCISKHYYIISLHLYERRN